MGKFQGFVVKDDQLYAVVQPRGEMAKGYGFWSVYDERAFSRDLVYRNINAYNHRWFSVYFADGVRVERSSFLAARVDYSIGMEMAARVRISEVTATGNVTAMGGQADVAFLFGIRGLEAVNNRISVLSIASNGWEVSNVKCDQPISVIDDSWVQGRIQTPA
jgi:hypothetical protein